ncbi:MAG: glucose-6-phosphate isomerase [Saprospiraceae bacterium]
MDSSHKPAQNRSDISAEKVSPQHINYTEQGKELKAMYSSLDEKQIPKLLFEKNPNLWVSDPEQVKEINQRLGWITLPDYYLENANEIIEFSTKIKNEGYTHVVLLGMGGSSLCSEVARETFGSTDGYPQLFVLDNTEPDAILDLENKIELDKTLFIAASKSGNTAETLSFFHFFYQQLEKNNNKNPGNNFVAITDDGTPLIKIAEQNKFRKVFVNPSDLGGRYSVLSAFGLVPMALMGIDIIALLSSASQMETSCKTDPSALNPGISLGVVLGIAQGHGRDKVTFILSSSISSFGFWVEQLIAESTGKEGRGLIPVSGESTGQPDVYSEDRIFIHMYLSTDQNADDHAKVKALEEAGHPIVRIELADKLALGGEFYRWEIATAIAGLIMKINPFDQPNVEESKKNTNQLLEGWIKNGAFIKSEPLLQTGNISIYAGKKVEFLASRHYDTAGDLINSFTIQALPDDYIAFLPYFMLTPSREGILQDWRNRLRDELKVATTLLNGPRYLHSTGQLHKGGPDTGLFILLMGDDEDVLPIPESKFGFDILHQAQALGDFRSLDEKGRRVIRIHLGKDIDAGLNQLYQSIYNQHHIS